MVCNGEYDMPTLDGIKAALIDHLQGLIKNITLLLVEKHPLGSGGQPPTKESLHPKD